MPKLFDEFDLDINKVKLNDDLQVRSDDTGGGSGGPACNSQTTTYTMSTCSCITCLIHCTIE